MDKSGVNGVERGTAKCWDCWKSENKKVWDDFFESKINKTPKRVRDVQKVMAHLSGEDVHVWRIVTRDYDPELRKVRLGCWEDLVKNHC